MNINANQARIIACKMNAAAVTIFMENHYKSCMEEIEHHIKNAMNHGLYKISYRKDEIWRDSIKLIIIGELISHGYVCSNGENDDEIIISWECI